MSVEKEKMMVANALKLTGGDPKKITSAIRKVIPSSLSKEAKAYLWRVLRPALEKKLCKKKTVQPASSSRSNRTYDSNKTKIALTPELMLDALRHELFHHSRQS